MRMRICIRKCRCRCMCACVCACVSVSVSVSLCVWIWSTRHTHTHTYTHTHTHPYLSNNLLSAKTSFALSYLSAGVPKNFAILERTRAPSRTQHRGVQVPLPYRHTNTRTHIQGRNKRESERESPRQKGSERDVGSSIGLRDHLHGPWIEQIPFGLRVLISSLTFLQ